MITGESDPNPMRRRNISRQNEFGSYLGYHCLICILFAVFYPLVDIKIGNTTKTLPALLVLAALYGMLGKLTLLKSVTILF